MRYLLTLFICFCANMAIAQAVPYSLDTARSTVGFTFNFTGTATQGTMPVSTANIQVDLGNVAASRIDVTLNPSQAKAGFVFATQTMKGAKVLDTANHPRIQFTSTRITGTVNAATVQGNVTIRGITRPLTLNAQLFRQHSTSLDDLSVLLTGSIDRNDFGADGFASYVGPRIDLKILARISK